MRPKANFARALTLVAIVAACAIPARATMAELVGTSVDSGWSTSKTAVGARYSTALRPESSASMTNRNGAAVSGTFAVSGPVITFRPSLPMVGELAPYVVTFDAIPNVPVPETLTTQHDFRLDPSPPGAPALTAPRPLVRAPGYAESGGAIDVSLAEPQPGALAISGEASDQLGPPPARSDAETSGVDRVEIRFFNPAKAAAAEVTNERITIDQQCYLRCPVTVYFDAEVDLDPGVWTMRVFAVDMAGTLSASSRPLTFVAL